MEALDSRTVSEWMAYASIEPFGEERADLRAGIIASTVANFSPRDRKKHPEPFSAIEFMPFIERLSPAEKLTQNIKQGFAKFPKQVKKLKG